MTDTTQGAEGLEEPRTEFERTLRRLAKAAMSVTHHDAAETEPGYIHEVQSMERLFRRILASRRAPTPPGGGEEPNPCGSVDCVNRCDGSPDLCMAALKRLTLAARASGGVAGPDLELMAACEQAEAVLSAPSPGAVTREALRPLLEMARKQWGSCKELRDAENALSRLQSAREGEEVMIPREPTEAMMEAGLYASSHDSDVGSVDATWKAMFDAVTLNGGCTTHAPSPRPGEEERLRSDQVRKFALSHDHLAVPIRPGVTVTWTDEESGETQTATLKGRNIAALRPAAQDEGERLREALREMHAYAAEAVHAAGCGFKGWEKAEARALAVLRSMASVVQPGPPVRLSDRPAAP